MPDTIGSSPATACLSAETTSGEQQSSRDSPHPTAQPLGGYVEFPHGCRKDKVPPPQHERSPNTQAWPTQHEGNTENAAKKPQSTGRTRPVCHGSRMRAARTPSAIPDRRSDSATRLRVTSRVSVQEKFRAPPRRPYSRQTKGPAISRPGRDAARRTAPALRRRTSGSGSGGRDTCRSSDRHGADGAVRPNPCPRHRSGP